MAEGDPRAADIRKSKGQGHQIRDDFGLLGVGSSRAG